MNRCKIGFIEFCASQALLVLVVGFFLLQPLRGYGQQSNPGSTFEATQKQAEKGDATAQDALGIRYATGDGTRQSVFEAARWFRKAAEQGNPKGQYHLALYYFDGERVDYKQATFWYRKAAEQGLADAQNKLGAMLAQGKGVSEDLDEATKWFQLAAHQGNAAANENLVNTLHRKRASVSRQEKNATVKPLQPKPTRQLSIVQSTNEIRTTDGVTYKSVEVLKIKPDGLLIEHSLQGGGIGMATLKFENLSAGLQQEYGYDPQKAAAYQAEQIKGQQALGRHMQAQQAQAFAAERAREQENFKGLLEREKLENERRRADAAQVQAEASRKQADAALLKAQQPPPPPVQVNVQQINGRYPYYDY